VDDAEAECRGRAAMRAYLEYADLECRADLTASSQRRWCRWQRQSCSAAVHTHASFAAACHFDLVPQPG